MRRLLPLLLLIACDDPPPPPSPAPVAAPLPRVALAAPRPIASSAAFDLVMGASGPILLYGPPSSEGGGLRGVRLEGRGGAVGSERVLIPSGSGSALFPEVVELAAATNGGRIRVGYVLRDQLAFTAHTLLADDDAATVGDVSSLGSVARPGSAIDQAGQGVTRRGSIEAAARGEGVELLYRGEDGPCAEGQTTRCARFGFHHLGEDPERRGLGYALPDVCARPVVGFAESDSVRYQALCAIEDGAPRTTVFAIQFEPRYAHAEPILAGCQPRGLSVVPSGVVVRGDCDGISRVVRVAEAGRSVTEGTASVRCVDARPVVDFPGGSAPLDSPRDRIEALLPETVCGANARAVWTGQSVLIAEPIGAEVSLRRFECSGGSFARTDHV